MFVSLSCENHSHVFSFVTLCVHFLANIQYRVGFPYVILIGKNKNGGNLKNLFLKVLFYRNATVTQLLHRENINKKGHSYKCIF